ncbi:MAG TPA: hypothetical protein VFO55_02230 [Gemmatimonadaceae bacterium]|nr:hypothetical protein [Gemmatimonadaceae bacterium]
MTFVMGYPALQVQIPVPPPPIERSKAEVDYLTLKAREKELVEQREELEDRRDELSEQYAQKTGIDQKGIEGRLSVVDQRLNQIESDLIQVGRDAAQMAPISIAEPAPKIIYRGFGEEDMVGAGFIGASLMLVLLTPFLYRAFRRRRTTHQANTAAATASLNDPRVDRMEQAIDSIAVEIERVSENQRFMTRLMTETQLAGTIAAVRGSTEAAKAAAEKAQNAQNA